MRAGVVEVTLFNREKVGCVEGCFDVSCVIGFFREVRPQFRDGFVFRAPLHEDSDDREFPVSVFMHEVKLHVGKFSVNGVFARRVEVELHEVVLFSVYAYHAAVSVIHLQGVAVIQDLRGLYRGIREVYGTKFFLLRPFYVYRGLGLALRAGSVIRGEFAPFVGRAFALVCPVRSAVAFSPARATEYALSVKANAMAKISPDIFIVFIVFLLFIGFLLQANRAGFQAALPRILSCPREVYDDFVARDFIEKRPSHRRAYGYLAVFRVNLFRGYEFVGEAFAGIYVFEIHL